MIEEFTIKQLIQTMEIIIMMVSAGIIGVGIGYIINKIKERREK